MKRILFYIIILLSIKNYAWAQVNLVPNPSFEIYSSCPTGLSQINLAVPWGIGASIFSTPDYYNQCGIPISKVNVPKNLVGYQNARTSVAYAGIIAYAKGNPNIREYIQAPLISSLLPMKKYCVEFYINLANKSEYAINSLGAYFSKDSIKNTSGNVLTYIPQIINPPTNILSDTSNWMLVSGILTAVGGEKYITIGNFNNDATIDTMMINTSGLYAYYYIDDISVTECSDTTISSSLAIPNIFTPNNDGTNDVFSITSKNIKTLTCKIYNRWGVKVLSYKSAVISGGATNIALWDGTTPSGLQCTEGVYYYALTAIGEDGKEYNEKGFVQLVR